ncbi:MAG TPA: hypothetical protein VMV77_05385 [Bacteroidales bacterium]|nr:hypothetical protein [Bacteroidales bacterium]
MENNEEDQLKLNELDYFEARGLDVLVFSNWYNGLFSDSKISGIEIIHHEVRTATNGDVRLSPTPEQWDPIPEFVERKVDKGKESITAFLKYSKYDFYYSINVEVHDNGLLISVNLENPLPPELVNKAGFNLEFLPSAYFEKAFLMDNRSGIFPLYPGGPMEYDDSGVVQPKPLAIGKTLVLAPEDPLRRIYIKSTDNNLLLFDGRNKAQNGWFVVIGNVLPW